MTSYGVPGCRQLYFGTGPVSTVCTAENAGMTQPTDTCVDLPGANGAGAGLRRPNESTTACQAYVDAPMLTYDCRNFACPEGMQGTCSAMACTGAQEQSAACLCIAGGGGGGGSGSGGP